MNPITYPLFLDNKTSSKIFISHVDYMSIVVGRIYIYIYTTSTRE